MGLRTVFAAGLVAGLAMLGAACGKKGAPLPPYRPDPEAVADLKAGQQGDQLVVSYTSPKQTVDAQKLEVHEVEILVTDQATGEIAKVGRPHRVRVAPGESRTELLPLAAPGATVRVAARARNGGRPSALSKTLTVTAQPAPPGPSSLQARNDPAGVLITWTTPAATPAVATATPTAAAATPAAITPTPTPTGPVGYLVRRRGPGGPLTLLTQKPIAAPPYLDETALTGGRWCYTVRHLVSSEPLLTSAESPEACVDIKDVRPPQPPSGLTVVPRETGLELTWNASTDGDLASYRVYRSTAGAEPQKIGERPAAERSFLDTTAAAGTTYRYRVTAVDTAGNESAAGPPAEAARP